MSDESRQRGESLAGRLEAVRSKMRAATLRRPAELRDEPEPRLVAVSKRHRLEAIEDVLALGQLDFGENYAQEFRDKLAARPEDDAIRWHFIGQLQSNKIKYLVGNCLIHTVDRVSLLEALERRAASAGVTQSFLVEVNAGEAQKGGVDPAGLGALLDAVGDHPHLHCAGLMTMAPAVEAAATRPYFRRLRELRDREARKDRRGVELRELSMGMSGDFEVAIEEGATLVRVGSAIFGERPS